MGKNKKKCIKKFIKAYKSMGVFLLNLIVLFIIINLLLGVVLIIHHAKPGALKLGDRLERAYPNFTKKEIAELLTDSWSNHLIYSPYVQFKTAPLKSKYINVHTAGFRKIKDQCDWPIKKSNENIFVFGGSTTFGIGVVDNQTIASHLQEILREYYKKNACVYNFGIGHYFSTQEKIFFMQLLSDGVIPDKAIFIDGLNEFYTINNEPEYTGRLSKYISKGDLLSGLKNLPFFRALTYIKTYTKLSYNLETKNKTELNKAIDVYFSNQKMIESIGKVYNVDTYFVIQPVPNYRYNLSYHFLYGIKDTFFGSHLNTSAGYELLSKKMPKSNKIVNLANIQENETKNLYVDHVHYNSEFSRKIANDIANKIARRTFKK